MFEVIGKRLHQRSVALAESLEGGLPRIMRYWLFAALAASMLRIAFSPLHGHIPNLATVFPYMLLTLAPLVSMALAMRWFANGPDQAQPSTRLAIVGRWRSVSPIEARAHPLFGTTGLMVSLMIGMLLNVPVRALEYFATMPALAGPVPGWLQVLHLMMTADVVVISSLYTIAFVAALRHVPMFPRLLAAIWGFDLLMQLAIATAVAASADLPPAVAGALLQFLDGNVQKVMISFALWLPYLLLSKRVNVTFRSRVPA